MRVISGVPASPGTAIGPVFLHCPASLRFERRAVTDLDGEWSRLENALEEASGQLEAVQSRASANFGEEESAIFAAQAAMVQDPELLSLAKKNLESTHQNAEAIWSDATEHYAVQLEALESEYMRARAADVRDVSNRVLGILLDVSRTDDKGPDTPSVICADDLSPSDTVGLDKEQVLGFCTARGGTTSHTAILARSLGRPAVVGAGESVLELKQGEQVILSGTDGRLIVAPSSSEIATYRDRQRQEQDDRLEALKDSGLPATTLDGQTVEIVANIGDVAGARMALETGAEGVGLLRTEFLYLERSNVPDEEEQYRAYRDITTAFGDRPVILRTLDVGGDKDIPYIKRAPEMNPFLGVRGLRLCLSQPDLFKPQLRAALRAGVGCNLKIMFPMVAVASEVRQAKMVLDECREELQREGKPFASHVEVGIMIEIPSAALLADHLASEVDFFSIGTNDLTQYTLAVDRTNAALSNLSEALSPAVLRLIEEVVRAAHAQNKWVGICGELAGELMAVPVLLGLELDELSMNPVAIPAVKRAIRSLSLEACKSMAEAVLTMQDAQQVRAYLASHKED